MSKHLSKSARSVKDKWVLLTGASGGIGEATAIRLYKANARLLLIGRDQEKLLALRIRNNFSEKRTVLIKADLGTQEGRGKVVAACQAIPEPLSILINNAGISDFNLLQRQDEKLITDLINTNLIAPILLTQALIPLLQKAPHPVIVNIGSTFGSIGYAGFSVYSASKFGLRGFTESLRRELANTPIDVCYVAPRATKTSINTDLVNAMNAHIGTTMDDPEIVAEHVLHAVEQRKAEIYIGWPEKLFAKINQLLPRLMDRGLLKQLPIICQFAQRSASS